MVEKKISFKKIKIKRPNQASRSGSPIEYFKQLICGDKTKTDNAVNLDSPDVTDVTPRTILKDDLQDVDDDKKLPATGKPFVSIETVTDKVDEQSDDILNVDEVTRLKEPPSYNQPKNQQQQDGQLDDHGAGATESPSDRAGLAGGQGLSSRRQSNSRSGVTDSTGYVTTFIRQGGHIIFE